MRAHLLFEGTPAELRELLGSFFTTLQRPSTFEPSDTPADARILQLLQRRGLSIRDARIVVLHLAGTTRRQIAVRLNLSDRALERAWRRILRTLETIRSELPTLIAQLLKDEQP